MHATIYAGIFGAFLHDVTRSRNNNYAKHDINPAKLYVIRILSVLIYNLITRHTCNSLEFVSTGKYTSSL